MLNESSSEIAELEIAMEGEPETEELSVISGGFDHQTRLESRNSKHCATALHIYFTMKLSPCEISFDTILDFTAH